MGQTVNGGGDDYNMVLARAQGERDRQSGASTEARNCMQGMDPQQILGAVMEVFKILAAFLSG